MASPAIDFVTYREFDYSVVEFASGMPLADIKGISYLQDGKFVRTEPRPQIEDLDALPWVTPIYKRDLDITRYNVPFLLHPYISFTLHAVVRLNAPSVCGPKLLMVMLGDSAP